ncbi:hypothetical protein K7X08_020204 [Anisodus acutangulus]|uniref:Uncharacterized protein n=1 Tax=Anisodus acutangulus TaxID=402998 RepID=A0A9Q1M6M3_9SOLA|nr:hypothetical protein K7X08_020204 [Anisodus acutangulus]
MKIQSYLVTVVECGRFERACQTSMGYVLEGDCWVEKEVEVPASQPEVDPSSEFVPLPDDVFGSVTAMDLKLDRLRELLMSQQDLLFKVKFVTQETCIDVSKLKMLLEKTSKDALKTLKNVFSALDSVEIKFDALQATIHEKIEDFKNDVVETLMHFLKS